jgi:hypothetical protein
MNKILVLLALLLLLVVSTVSAVQYPELPLEGVKVAKNYYEYAPSRISVVTKIMKPLVIMSVENIGKTPKNNTIQFVVFGNLTKTRVALITRQHGSEPASNFMSEGFVLEAVNDIEYKSAIRTYWVPIANPDGAWINIAENSKGQNINRFWDTSLCPEVNIIKGRIASTNLAELDMVIDQHALNGVEDYSLVTFSSKYDLNRTWLCGLVKKYLPNSLCDVSKCPATNTARGYYCDKGVKYSMSIETSQHNKTYTPAVTYYNGQQLEKIVKSILLR